VTLDLFAEAPLPAPSPLWEQPKQPNLLITPYSGVISREYLDLFIDEWLQRLASL
jgi:phosphoglycerate dehydrogenase-like enzyme